MKIASANYALCMAQSPAQKKKAAQTKSSLERYGSSCFLQLLDDEPAPVDGVTWMKLRKKDLHKQLSRNRDF